MEECIPAPDDTACRIDVRALSEAINAFLATLNEETCNIFVRRYWFLDPIADIAVRYGLSESKVKTTLYRTRKALKTYLEKEGFEL